MRNFNKKLKIKYVPEVLYIPIILASNKMDSDCKKLQNTLKTLDDSIKLQKAIEDEAFKDINDNGIHIQVYCKLYSYIPYMESDFEENIKTNSCFMLNNMPEMKTTYRSSVYSSTGELHNSIELKTESKWKDDEMYISYFVLPISIMKQNNKLDKFIYAVYDNLEFDYSKISSLLKELFNLEGIIIASNVVLLEQVSETFETFQNGLKLNADENNIKTIIR